MRKRAKTTLADLKGLEALSLARDPDVQMDKSTKPANQQDSKQAIQQADLLIKQLADKSASYLASKLANQQNSKSTSKQAEKLKSQQDGKSAKQLAGIGGRVPRNWRIHWSAEAKRHETTLTQAIIEAMIERFGLPEQED